MSVHAFSLVLSWTTILISLATVTLMAVARRRIYRAGWLDGRIDLLQHMARAQTSGVPFPDFVRQVAARDGFLIPDLPTKEDE